MIIDQRRWSTCKSQARIRAKTMTRRDRESRTIRDVTTCRREIVTTDVMNRESKRSREEIKASRQRGSAFLTWAGRSEVCLLTLSSGRKKVMMVTKQTVAKHPSISETFHGFFSF